MQSSTQSKGTCIGVFFGGVGCCILQCVGILVPQPGIEPTPPAMEARNPNHWTAKEVPKSTCFQSDLPQLTRSLPLWPSCACQVSPAPIPSSFPWRPFWSGGTTHRPCLRRGRHTVLSFIKFGSPIRGTRHMSGAPQLPEASGRHSRQHRVKARRPSKHRSFTYHPHYCSLNIFL